MEEAHEEKLYGVYCRMPAAYKYRLQELAEGDHRTMTNLASKVMLEWLDNQGGPLSRPKRVKPPGRPPAKAKANGHKAASNSP